MSLCAFSWKAFLCDWSGQWAEPCSRSPDCLMYKAVVVHQSRLACLLSMSAKSPCPDRQSLHLSALLHCLQDFIIWSDKADQGTPLTFESIRWWRSWGGGARRGTQLGSHLCCGWGRGNLPAGPGVGEPLHPRVPECSFPPCLQASPHGLTYSFGSIGQGLPSHN